MKQIIVATLIASFAFMPVRIEAGDPPQKQGFVAIIAGCTIVVVVGVGCYVIYRVDKAENKHSKCNNCGQIPPPQSVTCSNCGGAFRCADCLTRLPAGAKVCPECETKVPPPAKQSMRKAVAGGVMLPMRRLQWGPTIRDWKEAPSIPAYFVDPPTVCVMQSWEEFMRLAEDEDTISYSCISSNVPDHAVFQLVP